LYQQLAILFIFDPAMKKGSDVNYKIDESKPSAVGLHFLKLLLAFNTLYLQVRVIKLEPQSETNNGRGLTDPDFIDSDIVLHSIHQRRKRRGLHHLTSPVQCPSQ
jgi:hypothetical protein